MKTHYSVAKSLAKLLDEQFRIGGFSIGVDPLLNFFPVVGSVLGLMLSFYIIWIAKQVNASEKDITLMMINVVVDFFLGIIPVIGFVGDALFKANKKNLKILEKYMEREVGTILDAEIVSPTA